jgi:ubiquinone biosynthesis protein UbiJ
VDAASNPASALLDSIQNGLVAVAEIGGNRLLKLDPEVDQACAELQGCCVAIEITDLDFILYCHPGNWGIRLSKNAPASSIDATISGRTMALINLASNEDKLSTSMQEGVSFQGNVGLAQKLQAILARLDIDWEEVLAQQTGDVIAFQLAQQARKLHHWLRQSTDSILQSGSEYLREEIHLSPTETEFERFSSEATALKHAVERCEARLRKLLETAGKYE